jgi:large subunit ribosomal protein L10
MGKYLEGPTAIVFSWESPSAAAKVARDFAKGNEKFKLKGGYLEGNVLDEKGVVASADLPGKDEMRAALLATLVAPATNFVRTLNAGAQNFAYVIDARKRSLEAKQ